MKRFTDIDLPPQPHVNDSGHGNADSLVKEASQEYDEKSLEMARCEKHLDFNDIDQLDEAAHEKQTRLAVP